jgi:serine phosphatase RsbU (regulator of sigma subunit)
MTTRVKGLSRLPVSQLSRRIVLWVFISVIVIEILIFIPSFQNREKELLNQFTEVAAARVALIMRMVAPTATDEKLFDYVKQLQNGNFVVGGALYNGSGTKIGEFGEKADLALADLNPAGMTFRLSHAKTRYDIAWSPKELQRDYHLILRHDSSSVVRDLWAFFLRIAGLVLIISLFVTVGTWIPLGRIVVKPILNLRTDLIRAGEAIRLDRQTPEFYSANIHRQDELGEVIRAFHQMHRQISSAINERKQAEQALQESLQQVGAYSQVLKNELEKGRQIQKNFLPSQLLQIPGWETAAFFRPARQVAGDFYDVFKLPGEIVGFVVADVCDKGVGAALFMALFRSLIRIFSGQTALEGLPLTCGAEFLHDVTMLSHDLPSDPTHLQALKAVQLTNDYIALNHGDLAMFATLFFGILDPSNGVLSYISGGHEPLFIVNSHGGVKEYLSATGVSVGIQPQTKFRARQTTMQPGDILLGYTDGVLEATSAEGMFFSHARLQTILDTPSPSASNLIERIATSVQNHIGEAEQFDDITLLAIRRLP